MLGFTDYNIDAVVKFGGSLLDDEVSCRAAISSLVSASDKGYRILVVPGGGPTDNTIEKLDKVYQFASDTHHKACARAQDQTGIIICDNSFSSSLVACEDFECVASALDSKKVAVILPSKIIFTMNPFEKTWDITSDAMAAWFAWVANAKKVIIFKSVDGVFEKNNLSNENFGKLIERISAKELVNMGSNAVDACVAPFLANKRMNCCIIKGGNEADFINALDGNTFHGTFVIGNESDE